MLFLIPAGGVLLCAIIAVGSAVAAVRQRRMRSAALWAAMAVPLLLWAGNLVLAAAGNPALLSDTPPGVAR